MISICDVCPLSFNTLEYEFANKGSFRQCFDTSDGILLQVFCDGGESPSVSLNDKISSTSSSVGMSTYQVNDSVVMYYTTLYPEEGIYSVTIDGSESNEFEVCEGSNGILIEYSHKGNNSPFDAIFWNGETQLTFRMRIPGGFKPSGVTMEVDNEQFVNQYQGIVELYSVPYTTRTLSIGDSNGVPYFIAELINKILCLSYVSIGGVTYVREGNSKPEKVETLGQKELFLWSVTLRENKKHISGLGGKVEESVSASAVSFMIDSAKDGEVLVYDESESSFVNTDKLDSV